LDHFLKELNEEEELQLCYAFINDLYKTHVILSFPPQIMALTAILFTLSFKKKKPNMEWFQHQSQYDLSSMALIIQEWFRLRSVTSNP
jgi:hypothetical protein